LFPEVPVPKRKPVPQTEEWKATFAREMSPSLYSRLVGYADRISGKLHAVEGIEDRGYATTLALDAVGDTMQGIRRWDPLRRSLYSHLCGVVQSRAYHDTKRAQRWRRVAYHEPDHSDDATGENSHAETEMSLRREDLRARPDVAVTLVQLGGRFLEALRALAFEDDEVTELIECYVAGCPDRSEIMPRTGWSLPRFTNVRRRLDTLLRHLPDELRSDVHDVLSRPASPTMDRAA
jgi:hypothetical protein